MAYLLAVPFVCHDEDFTILSFARFQCAIRDLALLAIFSAASSAFLIVCSILSGAIPRRIRLSVPTAVESITFAIARGNIDGRIGEQIASAEKGKKAAPAVFPKNMFGCWI
jgi:hypothetical protein